MTIENSTEVRAGQLEKESGCPVFVYGRTVGLLTQNAQGFLTKRTKNIFI